MPTINRGDDYFQVVTYTGNGSTNTITGLRFKPDYVWIKGRSGATDHALYDSVRGTTKDLVSNSTAAETTQSTGLTSFNSDGFTLGALSKVNTNGATYVAWCWKASGTTSSNTNGSITSTVSVNATAGFSVVTFTGASTQGATFGHGLGVAPKMVIAKSKTGTTQNWWVYHVSLGYTNNIYLNSTAASFADGNTWRATPSSTLVTIGDNFVTSGTYVAYCWAAIPGYSAFGSYTGNGSADGVFVATNFTPKFIMIKRTDTANDWNILNSSQQTYNQIETYLLANSSNAEGSSGNSTDFLSNGFKLRTSNAWGNANGGTYIYMAFASNPFKNSLAR